MITNEDRREVAGKLLDTTTKLRGASFWFEWEANLEEVLGLPVKLTSKDRDCIMAALDRLEDLIEPGVERTCENESSEPGIFTCSYCGADFYDTEISGDWNYCPNCGVKVVENEVTPTPL